MIKEVAETKTALEILGIPKKIKDLEDRKFPVVSPGMSKSSANASYLKLDQSTPQTITGDLNVAGIAGATGTTGTVGSDIALATGAGGAGTAGSGGAGGGIAQNTGAGGASTAMGATQGGAAGNWVSTLGDGGAGTGGIVNNGGAGGYFQRTAGNGGLGNTSYGPAGYFKDVIGITSGVGITATPGYYDWYETTTFRMRLTGTGKLGIGVQTPTAYLHLLAGTATANTAPLKIDPGSTLTVPEMGTLEYVDVGGAGVYGDFYLTPKDNATATRHKIVLTEDTTSLIAGRVSYAGTGGRLKDSNTFTYNGTTLTVGTLTTGSGSITDSSGAISFSNENLATTGTLGAGSTTVTNLTDSGLTITRIPYASTGGLLIDSANLTFSGTVLGITGDVGLGTATPGDLLPPSPFAAGSRILEVKSSSTSTDSALLLRRSDGATGLDLWSDNSTGIDYIDNRWNGGTLNFRVNTSATAKTVLGLNGTEVVVNDASGDVDFRVETDGNTNMLHIDGGINRIGIGTAATLDSIVQLTATTNDNASSENYGLNANLSFQPANDVNKAYYGVNCISNIYDNLATGALINTYYGGSFRAYARSATRTITGLIGGLFDVRNLGSGTFANITAQYAGKFTGSTGGGTTTDFYGAFIANPTGAGTVTNAYGLYIENIAKGGTLNYAIKTNGGLVDFGNGAVSTTGTINKLTITAPATSATLTLVTGSSLITAGAYATTLTSTNTTNVTLPTTGTLSTLAGTETLTNKRITKRTGTTTSSATPTINTDNVEFYSLTAQAEDITSFTTNLSGTPTENQTLWIAITGTAARAITWGTSFEASTVALPTTTVTTARLDVGFVWNTVTSKWRVVAVC